MPPVVPPFRRVCKPPLFDLFDFDRLNVFIIRTHRRRIEESKYLGGSMDDTHKVRGLDVLLRDKARRGETPPLSHPHLFPSCVCCSAVALAAPSGAGRLV